MQACNKIFNYFNCLSGGHFPFGEATKLLDALSLAYGAYKFIERYYMHWFIRLDIWNGKLSG